MSKEVADEFVEALRKLEEDRNVEALVEIHAEDCEVGNVAVPRTFSGHEGLREFWTSYRKTFNEMKSEFRKSSLMRRGMPPSSGPPRVPPIATPSPTAE
jgi:hypothetical protein